MDYTTQDENKKKRDLVLSSSSIPQNLDFTNITINNPPLPQAASTVERKYERKTKSTVSDIDKKSDNLQEKLLQDLSVNSSLGIIDLKDITAMLEDDNHSITKEGASQPVPDLSTERKLARQLLEKCRPISVPVSKESKTDTTQPNLLSELTNTHSVLSSSILKTSTDDSTLVNSENKSTNASVLFQPNEIAARSSEFSKMSEKSLLFDSSQMLGRISFNTATAEMMGQFGDEEFHELNSQVLEQFGTEQSFTVQKASIVPSEKSHLNLDFSGFIGELNLTHESGNGSKISIGDYFKKKCGNIGKLSETDVSLSERPSFGLNNQSPQKRGKPRPLVDVSVSTEASDQQENFNSRNTTDTEFTSEFSRLNLSSIAKILKDQNDSASPRLIVDNLLNAKKQRMRSQSQSQKDKTIGDTYTLLPINRNSLPTSSCSMPIDIQTPEKDTTLTNRSSKMSLENKTYTNDNLGSKIYDKTVEKVRAEKINSISLGRNFQQQEAENELFISHLNRKSTDNRLSQPTFDSSSKLTSQTLQLSIRNHNNEEIIPSPYVPILNKSGKEIEDSVFDNVQTNLKHSPAQKDNNLSPVNKENLKAMKNSSLSPRERKNIIIGKKSQEVTTCIIGVATETAIEIVNNGERWILVTPSSHQIQGDKENIRLNIPGDTILLKPNSCECIKIDVTITKLCKPIMTGICLTMSDMVTREIWDVMHMMCFIPEEPKIHISLPSEKEELDFEKVAENGYKTLPITIENKNNINVTIDIQIVQKGPAVFFIDNSENETLKSNASCDGTLNMVLKPKESITTHIEIRGAPLDTFKDSKYNVSENLCHVDAKLIIVMSIAKDIGLIVKEVPLLGCIGIIKIEPVDAQFPIVVFSNQSKLYNIRNTGSIPATVHAAVTADNKEDERCFKVMPENFVLECGEKGCIVITYEPTNPDNVQRNALLNITIGNSVYTYPVRGEKILAPEPIHDGFLRCDTPQMVRRTTSPSSPQSAISNGSGNSGRYSPGSSCGGSSVTGDVIPIRATHNALVWGSVKAGKRDTKEFTIRNMSSQKIKLVAGIETTDKSFKFFREGYGTVSNVAMNLQGNESKTLSVVFEPNAAGAVAGKIMFHYYTHKRENLEGRPTKVIQLYGYGGFGKLEILEAFKDTNGQMWMSLGNLSSEGSLEAKIKLRNNGDLPCYAKIDLIPKVVHPTMQLSWQVIPKEFLVQPKQIKLISLDFRPKKKDLDVFKHTDVSHVGTLRITHGDEPTRLRIRRLYSKMKETGQLHKKVDSFKNVVSPLCKAFPGEEFISDLAIIRDSVQNLGELCRGINEHEVRLTMEMNGDDTESFMSDNMDETATFHSLYNDSSNDVTYTGQSFMPSETMEECSDTNDVYKNGFIVEPPSVTLIPPTVNEATIILSSVSTSDQYFQCMVPSMDYISVIPSTGKIPPRKSVPLKVLLKKPCSPNFTTMVEIYTENHRRDVMIKVKNDKKRGSLAL